MPPASDAYMDRLRRLQSAEQRERDRTVLVAKAAEYSRSASIEWLARYERAADARRKAWEDSPFHEGFCRVFPCPTS
jgi:hypothetical protein